MLVWRCQCGEEFPEHGRERPGDVSGWTAAVSHSQEHKRNKEPERIVGLIDTDTGEVLYEGGYRPGAVAAGILPYGPKDKNVKNTGAGPYQGKVLIREIPIDPAVIMCFYEAQYRWPQDYPNDDPQSISKFITECVLSFFQAFSDELSMGKLIENTVRTILSQKESEEPSEAIESTESTESTEPLATSSSEEFPKEIPNVLEPFIEKKPKKKRGRPKKNYGKK